MDEWNKIDLKDAWENCNNSTTGFFENIPKENWETKPFKNRFKTFVWEFACLARTRLIYIKGLKGKKMDFSHQDDVPDKEILVSLSKGKVWEYLQTSDKEITQIVSHINTAEQVGLMIWLLQHERIHHGKLMLYLSQAGLSLPKGFIKTWGESNFAKK